MSQELVVSKEEFQKQLAEGSYINAINIFGALVDRKEIHEELFYDLAYAYYRMGDYERAANWISNTISKYPQHHVKAKLLLAQLCFREKRTSDALALYNQLLAGNELTHTDKETMRSLALPVYQKDKADIKRNFPRVAKFLKKGLGKAPAAVTESDPKQPEGKGSVLERLKAKIAEAKAKDKELHEQNSREQNPYESEDAAEIKPAEKAAALIDAAQVAKDIVDKAIPPREKIRSLNAFAGFCYAENRLEDAKLLLKEALTIDSSSEFTLRNMALVIYDLGDRDTALQLAAKMKRPDFTLIRILRG